MMKNLILFGAGEFGQKTCRYLKKKGDFSLEFVDNDDTKWNNFFEGVKVYPPSHVNETNYDYIVVCVSDLYYAKVRSQLRDELHVDDDVVIHWSYWLREDFLGYYKNLEDSPEIQGIVKRVEKSDRLCAFNYEFTEKYEDFAQCFFDDSVGLYYVIYQDKRLYFNRKYTTKLQIEHYANSLLMEQDAQSPHRYLNASFAFEGGCLLDVGAAEGNFSLEVIERADRIILLECDNLWIEALQKTFEPWKNKVVIINKYLSDKDGEYTITIDTLSKEYDIDFIKMDIEGAEVSAIKGGLNYIRNKKQFKMAVCVYHNLGDEEIIRGILKEEDLVMSTTGGYMVFPDNMDQPPRLVHGVLRIEKNA